MLNVNEKAIRGIGTKLIAALQRFTKITRLRHRPLHRYLEL
jgi:hypothetical protein